MFASFTDTKRRPASRDHEVRPIGTVRPEPRDRLPMPPELLLAAPVFARHSARVDHPSRPAFRQPGAERRLDRARTRWPRSPLRGQIVRLLGGLLSSLPDRRSAHDSHPADRVQPDQVGAPSGVGRTGQDAGPGLADRSAEIRRAASAFGRTSPPCAIGRVMAGAGPRSSAGFLGASWPGPASAGRDASIVCQKSPDLLPKFAHLVRVRDPAFVLFG